METIKFHTVNKILEKETFLYYMDDSDLFHKIKFDKHLCDILNTHNWHRRFDLSAEIKCNICGAACISQGDELYFLPDVIGYNGTVWLNSRYPIDCGSNCIKQII